MGEQKEDGDRHFLEVPEEAQKAMCISCNKEMSVSKALEKILSWCSNITTATQTGCEFFSFLDIQNSSGPVTSHLDPTLSEGVSPNDSHNTKSLHFWACNWSCPSNYCFNSVSLNEFLIIFERVPRQPDWSISRKKSNTGMFWNSLS